MDADERLTALKRAYADIILNTAKEAAARIMASERKALRFQHELGVAKEQALQMLLRLKNMMDSKASEAGMTCWSQQKTIEELQAQLREAEDSISEADMRLLSQHSKIEELEAQLHEAEDIVKDVREELREVQGELERVRSSKLLHMDEYNTATQEETSQANMLNTSQSIRFHPPELQLEPFTSFDLRSSVLNQRNDVYKCYSVNDSRIGSSHMGKLDLPSTSEEKRLNTPFSILPSSPELKPESLTGYDLKISPSNQRSEVNKCYNANGFRVGTSHASKPDVPSIILRRKEPEPFRNRRTLRIRAFEEKLMAGELAFSDTIDVNNETNGREGEEPEAKKKNVARADKGNYQGQKVKTLRRKRRRATSYQKKKPPSSRYAFNQALKGDQTSDSSCIEPNNVNASAQSCGDPSNMGPRSIGCKDKDITESDAEFGKDVSVENTINEDKASIDELLLTRQESGSADRSGVSTCRVDVEKVDVPVPVENSRTETSGTTNGIADYTRTDGRVFKYTFQRKRKKGSLSCSEGNDSLENGVLKKRAAEEQNGPLEAEKSSSITALPRDSRRLAQVARQLISLSEKKW